MSGFNWTLTPEQFLREIGAAYKKKGNWLSLETCIFCDGGSSGDTYSLSVHYLDGNFFCHRGKCGERGSFWKFIESMGRAPREYLGERRSGSNRRKKKYMYGRQ